MATMAEPSPTTEGLGRIAERFRDPAALADCYPDGATFIAADLPDFGRVLHRAILEREPIVVVYPDGRERVVQAYSPRGRASVSAFVRRHLRRPRSFRAG